MFRLCGRRLYSVLLGNAHNNNNNNNKVRQFTNRCCFTNIFPTYTCLRANSSKNSTSSNNSNSNDNISAMTEQASTSSNEKNTNNAETSVESKFNNNETTMNNNNDPADTSEKSESNINATTCEYNKQPLRKHSSSANSTKVVRHRNQAFINSVTLVGVVHDIQTGYVFEDAVTQFTLTTTSLETNNPTQECIVEKDHHTVRCFGDVFSQEIKDKLAEGNVVCVNGRLRLNPQLEPSCNKYYYFPYIQVQPPHGQVSVIYGDCRTSPNVTNAKVDEINCDSNDSNNTNTTSSDNNNLGKVKK